MNASARIEELKKRYDESPRRFFAPLANEYRKAGDLEKAIALCKKHLGDQPGNMNGHVVYGQSLFESGLYEEATATFLTALTLDPENLIALRHLGDMSRAHGDNEKAREWYTRVLDADPRNEEIIHFLAEIDTAFLAGPARAVPAPEPVSAAPVSAAPASEPTPKPAPERVPEPAPIRVPDYAPAEPVARSEPLGEAITQPVSRSKALGEAITEQIEAKRPTPKRARRVITPTATARTAEAEKVEAKAAEPTAVEPTKGAQKTVEPKAVDREERPEVVEKELVETASVEPEPVSGASTVTIESASTLIIDRPVNPVGKSIPGVSPPPRPSLDLSDFAINVVQDVEFPEPPSAKPAAAPEAPANLHSFGDIIFGEPTAESPPHDEALASTSPGEFGDGLGFGNFEFSMDKARNSPPDLTSAAHPETNEAAQPAASEAAASEFVERRTPEAAAEVVPSVSGTPRAFVTETMAELYLRQGFRGEALAVYRQLVVENPRDEKLLERVRELEQEDRSSHSGGGAVPLAARPVSPAAGGGIVRQATEMLGRTAREFFASLASRRALRRDGTPPNGMSAPDVLAPAPDGAVAPRVSNGGSLDSLFGGADVPPEDERVALAFARVGEAVEPGAIVKGRPTQPAQSELSLEHLFRDTPVRPSKSVPRQSDKLRFDQFFAPASEAGQEAPRSVPPPADEPGSPAELEQFQDWLQHLKKP